MDRLGREGRRAEQVPAMLASLDEWDMQSFDPDLDTPPLAHFERLVRRRITGA